MSNSDSWQAAPVRAMVRRIVTSRDPKTLLLALRLAGQILAAHLYLRRCTRIGRITLLSGRPRIQNKGSIVIGNYVTIHSTHVPVVLTANDGGAIEIGDQSYLNYGVSISAHKLVRIGQRCLFAPYVSIMDNNWHDITDRLRTPPSQPVILEDNVWLGTNVIVLPGVTIGHDTVVGAGAVVVKDVPPRSVAVGNPARVVKTF